MIDQKDSTASPATESLRIAWHRIKTGWWTPSQDGSSSDWMDVWSRTAPKYRYRSIILLLLNVILFFGLGSFTSWLKSGKTIPFFEYDYWDRLYRTFNPSGEHQVTLLDFLLNPISIEYAPIQIIVLGLLLATLISIPILVAMLYRLPCSLIFILIVGFVAVLPWLALTLLLSCLLTSLRPLRFKFRYATALIAMIPVVVYLLSATRNPVAEATYVPPIVSTLLYMPWLLAILVSCLLMAIVLLIAKIVQYRPGAISPLLAISFAIPVALFEYEVGRDELYYRLLEKNFGPHSKKLFREEDASVVIHRLAEQKQAEYEREGRKRDLAGIEAEIRFMWQFQIDPLGASDNAVNLFKFQQDDAVRNCDWFRRTYPSSRYIPNVLYLMGRVIDMRIDIEAFRRDKILTYYQNFPNQNSAKTWTMLCEQYPDSPVTAVAMLRLAQLEARDGKIDEAVDRLRTLEKRFSSPAYQTTRPAPTSWLERLEKPQPTSSLGLHLGDIVHSASKLCMTLTTCRDPHLAILPEIPSDAPLVEWLRCDPRHRHYAQNLRMLIAKYPLSRLQTRLRLEEILIERSSSLKIHSLEVFLDKHKNSKDDDAVAEAFYRLGEAYLRDNRPRDAVEILRRLSTNHPASPWVEDAMQQLSQLAAVETDAIAP